MKVMGVIGIIVIIVVLGWFVINQKNNGISSDKLAGEQAATQVSMTKTQELKIVDTQEGTGAEVKGGDTVVIHYTGKLADGTKFDSSYDRGEPFVTAIGVGKVIQGWDEGVVGMKVGGKRTLTIPPDKAYGEQGIPGAIPPNATLVFDVELIEIR